MKLEKSQPLDAFGALSQEARLRMVRVLVQAGPDGLSAGAVGDAVGASFHLSYLDRAGLITSRRQSRSTINTANFEGLGALVEFLQRDCCSGHSDICAPAAAAAAQSTPIEKEITCAC